ncbi:hypothetical protein D3C78_1677080 [compost metagenome]
MHPGGQAAEFDSAHRFTGGVGNGGGHRIGRTLQFQTKRRGADLAVFAAGQDIAAGDHHAVTDQGAGLQ